MDRLSGFALLRSLWSAWLTRPLTSFHLVLAVFGLLTAFGLVMVLSASAQDSIQTYGSPYRIFLSQLGYVAVGLVLFYLALRTPPRLIRQVSLPLLVMCVVLLVLVLTPLGSTGGGAQSWFRLGPVGFQPVEAAKVAFGLWGAHVLATKRAMLSQWRHVLVPVVPVALVMFALVMLQPDLGSTVTLGIVLMGLLWFAGASMRLFAILVLAFVSGAIVLALTAGYRLARITSFLGDGDDHLDAGYQARQALYALADGGLFGQGLGQGSTKWSYLPMVHNDFIFAVVGEELGFVGAVLLLCLFGTLGYVGLRIAARNTDPWMRLVASSLTVWLVGQAAINVGYVVGLLPVTGLPLPMISSGGSATVTTMVVFGILANLARHEPEAVAALRAQRSTRVSRWLRLPLPDPYRPPAGRRRPVGPSAPPRRTGQNTAARRGGGAPATAGRRRVNPARSTGGGPRQRGRRSP
nr:putative lipid II flippase FtsW [Actinoalloteichus caeruleus]